jgi:hypothetical protein
MANLYLLSVTRLEASLFIIAPILGLLLIMVLIEAAAKFWPVLKAAKQQQPAQRRKPARHRLTERKAI